MTKKKSKAGAAKLEDPQSSERLLGGASIDLRSVAILA